MTPDGYSKWAHLLLSKEILWASLVAQMVTNPPTVQETQIQSLGWKDPLEKATATHSSILAWRIPRTEEFSVLVGYSSWVAESLRRLSK